LTAKPVNTKYHRISLTGMHPVNSRHPENSKTYFSDINDNKAIEY
jgi:hypothetical protein